MMFTFAFVLGFVAAIYIWPKIKVLANGAYAEATALHAKADALLAKAKGVL